VNRSASDSGQRGAALLLALIISAIAAGIAANMLFRTELQISGTGQLVRQVQARQLAAGMEDWAIGILQRDAEVTPLWDGLEDPWAQPLPPTPIPGGEISGQMTDLSGRFNLNSLLDPVSGTDQALAIRRFRRLVIEVLNLDPAIVDQTLDLMDRDTTARPLGFETVPGAGFLRHERELDKLPALGEPALGRLLPLVAALPPRSGINVNTAPPEILMALAPGIDANLALRISPARGRPWESVARFTGQPLLREIELEPEGLDVRSAGFLARALMVTDAGETEFSSVIFRGGTRADSSYHVRNRSMAAPR
jgi:general secretion pathway protein K